ncbi:hypothetical protein S21ZY_128 [Pseudomonas phage ZY21]|nr:hypothetical protein S21ZY_128 [Pseudomonas phage ZY21]
MSLPGFHHWVLNDRGIAVVEPDMVKWGEWMMKSPARFVARSELHHVTVSTIFLGIDYGYDSELPVLFETMVFQGERDAMNCAQPVHFAGAEDSLASALWGDCRRYSFLCDALEGHKQAVLSIEQQFGQVQDKVSGLIYGIMNSEEWVKDQ